MSVIFSLDVETIGVHGSAFSYGYVVRNDSEELEFCGAAMPSALANGTDSDREWVAQNVSEDGLVDVEDFLALSAHFASAWSEWSARGALMMADCPVPCEASFLRDARASGAVFPWPYPLLDVESARAARGMICQTASRTDEELPAHHPVADARQSARLWFEVTNAR